jgi:hypothetical protein
LREVEGLGGPAEMPVFRHGEEGAKLAHRDIHVNILSLDKIKRFALSAPGRCNKHLIHAA